MTLFILIFVSTLALSLYASWKVRNTYQKYAEIDAASGFTGAEIAYRMMQNSGIHDVEIHAIPGQLNDHYDPMNKRLVLSEGNFNGRSISALAVAAHEAGHAIQHAKAYAPLHLRMAAVGVTNFASHIVTWLPLIGLFTGIFSTYTGVMLMALGWGVIMLFNLITLPVEFDASNRAKVALASSGYISYTEKDGVNKVLNAAALTYVGAFITSLAYLIYYLLPLMSGQEE